MRIQFSAEIEVDIHAVPRTAWGRLQKRAKVIIPDNAPIVDGEVKALALPMDGPLCHYFRPGAIVELPDEVARRYIDQGVAAVYVSERGPIVHGPRPEPAALGDDLRHRAPFPRLEAKQ